MAISQAIQDTPAATFLKSVQRATEESASSGVCQVCRTEAEAPIELYPEGELTEEDRIVCVQCFMLGEIAGALGVTLSR
jgi:hypothetical protein